MKSTTASAFLAFGLAVQQAAATGWTNAKSFSNPSNTNNVCTQEQQGGFDWSGLSLGSFNSYGGFSFSGFACKDSFQKRDILRARNIQSKCISGSVSKKAQSSPKVSCGSDKSFSIKRMQVSASVDTELDFLYGMKDGSTCKQRSSCSAGGSTVQNTQCGGATSVTFKLPDDSKHNSCDVGIHSIGFDCGTASATVKHVSTTSRVESSASSAPAISTSAVGQSSQIESSSSSSGSTTAVGQSSQIESPSSSLGSTTAVGQSSQIESPSSSLGSTTAVGQSSQTEIPSSSLGSSTAPNSPVTESAGVPMTTSTIFSTSVFTVTSCAPEVTNCPARSTPQVVTSIIAVGTTVCPVSSAAAATSSSTAGSSSAAAGSSSAPAESSTAPAGSSSAPVSPETQASPSLPSITAITTSAGPASSGEASLITQSSSSQAAGSTLFSNGTPMTTSTVFSTIVSTITSCAPTVTNCPAHSTEVVTSIVAISTTVCPVASVTGSSALATSAPESSAPASSTTGSFAPVFTESISSSSGSTAPVSPESGSSAPPSPASSAEQVTSLAPASGQSSAAPITTSSSIIAVPVVESPSASIQESITTVIVVTSVTTCPVTTTVTSGTVEAVLTTQTVSTVLITSTSTICTKCIASSTSGVPQATGSSSGSGPAIPVESSFAPAVPAGSSAPASPEQSSSAPSSSSDSSPAIPAESSSPPAVPAGSSAASPAQASSPPAPPAACPSVLPKCLNTWIFSTGCADNADASCYCAQSNFTTNVIGCIQSWGADSEVQSALSYLAGICANHIKQNPAIITAMPSSITLAPVPAAPTPSPSDVAGATQGSAAAPLTTAPAGNVPVTTIQIQQTVTVPCTFTNGASSGSAIPSSSTTTVISSQVIVPQVQFITQAAAGTTSVIKLAAGSPSSAPASATAPAAAVGASGVNVPAGYGVPTTLASSYAALGNVAQGNPTATTSSGIVLFTGAASAMSPGIMVSGAVGGMLALLFQL